jgi:hypothetical protein
MTPNHLQTPSEEVSVLLRKLRIRYAANRLLALFTISLALDLCHELVASLAFNLARIRIGFPFFFEILFAVLILRELPKFKMERFASALDRRWALKDRLYSHTWFVSAASVQKPLVDAQARECLGSIDFQSLLTSMRVRIPKLLFLIVPMAAVVLYLSWNAEYRPPGITSRTVLNIILPEDFREEDPETVAGLTGETTGQEQADDRSSSEEVEGDSDDPFSSVDQADGVESGSRNQPISSDTENEEIPGPGELNENAEDDPDKRLKVAPPKRLASNPTTDKLSAVRPKKTERTKEGAFRSLPEATQFLNLIPGHQGGGTADLDPQTVQNFEKQIGDHPPKYRQYLETYYQELKR